MKRIFYLLAFLLVFPYLIVAQTPSESLTESLEQLLDKSEVAGFSVAVVHEDSLMYLRGFGYANREHQIPYSIHTVQPVASLAKTLIGISLMKAQEMGKLDLDDNINDYLPFKIVHPYHPEKKITIRHLASHSSGLIDPDNSQKAMIIQADFASLSTRMQNYLSEYHCGPCGDNENMSLLDFIKAFYQPEGKWYDKNNFLSSAPGEEFSYSNYGAALAALVIERATGENYKDFTRKYIFKPLQMNRTDWHLEDFSPFQRSVLYGKDMPLPSYRDITYPDGSMVTSAADFSKFLSVMMKGFRGKENILKPESFKEMMSLQVKEEFGYGVFWEIKSGRIGHGGSHAGVTTYTYFEEDAPFAFLVFFNTSDTEDIKRNLIEALITLKEYAHSQF